MITPLEYQYLLSVKAIQERADQFLQLALENKTHFNLHLDKLDSIADLTIKIIHANYPHGKIPLHSRWRHFENDGQNRVDFLQELPLLEQAKAKLDLAMISVLLDAGAGSAWSYHDHQGQKWVRSEGLAIASVDMFASGEFSAIHDQPWRVDGEDLQQLSLERLAAGLQVNAANPLLGLTGRLHLLHNLGRLLSTNKAVFPNGRPAGLYEYLLSTFGNTVNADDLVKELLQHLNDIWPGQVIDGYTLGDVWHYPGIGWAPFHKLTLWLTLSLIEPLQGAQLKVIGLEQLPGLAEYRNGGLFMDGGALSIKDRRLLENVHQPSDPLIVEWRALTIALLEKLALIIREKLGVNSQTLPLVNILQGGTWQAGRQLAFQRNPAGEPPLQYRSTGTIF